MTVDAFRAWEAAFLRGAKAALKPVSTSRPTTSSTGTIALRERQAPKLEEGFKRLGMSAESAGVAARARGARSSKVGSLLHEGQRLGLVPAAARTFARGRGLREAVTDGSGFKASDYAYAPDAEDPTSWKLLLVKNPGDGATGAYDPDLVRAAATALATPDWGGPVFEIPSADLPAVKQTIRGAWIQAGLPIAEIPPALDEAALHGAFRKLGMSEAAAAVAARGRDRRRS
jgi:hypothetical protein